MNSEVTAFSVPGDSADSSVTACEPETTINGPTLDITTTKNYSADTIDNVTAVTFDNTAASTATFAANQFGAGAIADDATITGDAAASPTFDGSGLQFSNWSSADKFEIRAVADHVTVAGTSGNDLIDMGTHLDGTDTIDGGDGKNTVMLAGNYSSGLTLTSDILQNIQKIDLAKGDTYALAFTTGVVAAGHRMTVNDHNLGASTNLTIDVSGDTQGAYTIYGGAGVNTITLNNQTDTVIGTGELQTYIHTTGVLPAGDKFEGTGDVIIVYLDGDYSSGYTFTASQISNVTSFILTGNSSYNLKMDVPAVDHGDLMGILANELGPSASFTFDGRDTTTGGYQFYACHGGNNLDGRPVYDVFWFLGSSPFTSEDRINGEGGFGNTVELDGHYTAGLRLTHTMAKNIQDIDPNAGNSYSISLGSHFGTENQELYIAAGGLTATDSLTFNGLHAASNLNITGG